MPELFFGCHPLDMDTLISYRRSCGCHRLTIYISNKVHRLRIGTIEFIMFINALLTYKYMVANGSGIVIYVIKLICFFKFQNVPT